MASVYVHFNTKPNDYIFSSADFTDVSLAQQNKSYYVLSKIKAELVAWEFIKDKNCPFTLTVINPCLILGPQLPRQTHLNTSSAFVIKYFDGSMKEIENNYRALVDVRDVAEAHINALEINNESVFNKRFVLVASCPHLSELYEIARNVVPDEYKNNVPNKLSEIPIPNGSLVLVDNKPSQEILGIKYRSVKELTTSAILSCIENGFTHSDMYNTKKL